jgi:hypothetical protein
MESPDGVFRSSSRGIGMIGFIADGENKTRDGTILDS